MPCIVNGIPNRIRCLLSRTISSPPFPSPSSTHRLPAPLKKYKFYLLTDCQSSLSSFTFSTFFISSTFFICSWAALYRSQGPVLMNCNGFDAGFGVVTFDIRVGMISVPSWANWKREKKKIGLRVLWYKLPSPTWLTFYIRARFFLLKKKIALNCQLTISVLNFWYF